MAAAAERQVDFATFYEMVQLRAGIEEPRSVVQSWDEHIQGALAQEFEAAVIHAELIGQVIPDLAQKADGTARSNQSKGNVMARVLCEAFADEGADIRLLPIKGAGYPDRVLRFEPLAFTCSFEIKATSDWKDADSNRRVLTSSPDKLIQAIARGELPDPPCHLLGTVVYDDDTAEIEAIRLDFLQPETPVGVRLEASTSHKLLATGDHLRIVIQA